MKTLEDLGQLYATTILPELQGLEKERKIVQGNLAILAACTAAAVFAVLYCFLPACNDISRIVMLPLILIILGLVGAISRFFYLWLTRGYIDNFKLKILPKLIAFIDTGLEYYEDGCVSDAVFVSSMLFHKWPNVYSGQDYVFGKIGETRIQFSEIDAKYQRTNSDGHKETQPLFKGLFFAADFNKNLKGRTFVMSDMAKRLLGEFYGQALQALNHDHGELVKLENPDFNREFVVYSTDQIEARYILTPTFMARLLKYNRMNGETLSMSFVGNKIFAAFPKSKDSFAPNIFGPLLEFGQVVKYYAKLKVVTRIVDDLHLDTRIWTCQ